MIKVLHQLPQKIVLMRVAVFHSLLRLIKVKKINNIPTHLVAFHP